MSYILDAIIILIILFGIITSAKKGFVRTLIEVVGFVAAIVIALTFSSLISNTVYDKMVEPTIAKTVEATVTEGAQDVTEAVDTVWNKMPKFITESSFLDLSKNEITQKVELSAAGGTEALTASISENFAKPVVTKLLSVILSVVLVIVLLFVVKISAKYINKLFSISFVGDINKTLGGILGIIKGGTLAVVFCLIVTLIISFTKNGFLIFTYDAINSSYIFKFISGFSPFM